MNEITKEDWIKWSKKEPPKNLPGAYRGAWLDGEMAGYSRCMVEKVLPLMDEIENLKPPSDVNLSFKFQRQQI